MKFEILNRTVNDFPHRQSPFIRYYSTGLVSKSWKRTHQCYFNGGSKSLYSWEFCNQISLKRYHWAYLSGGPIFGILTQNLGFILTCFDPIFKIKSQICFITTSLSTAESGWVANFHPESAGTPNWRAPQIGGHPKLPCMATQNWRAWAPQISMHGRPELVGMGALIGGHGCP